MKSGIQVKILKEDVCVSFREKKIPFEKILIRLFSTNLKRNS